MWEEGRTDDEPYGDFHDSCPASGNCPVNLGVLNAPRRAARDLCMEAAVGA